MLSFLKNVAATLAVGTPVANTPSTPPGGAQTAETVAAVKDLTGPFISRAAERAVLSNQKVNADLPAKPAQGGYELKDVSSKTHPTWVANDTEKNRRYDSFATGAFLSGDTTKAIVTRGNGTLAIIDTKSGDMKDILEPGSTDKSLKLVPGAKVSRFVSSPDNSKVLCTSGVRTEDGKVSDNRLLILDPKSGKVLVDSQLKGAAEASWSKDGAQSLVVESLTEPDSGKHRISVYRYTVPDAKDGKDPRQVKGEKIAGVVTRMPLQVTDVKEVGGQVVVSRLDPYYNKHSLLLIDGKSADIRTVDLPSGFYDSASEHLNVDYGKRFNKRAGVFDLDGKLGYHSPTITGKVFLVDPVAAKLEGKPIEVGARVEFTSVSPDGKLIAAFGRERLGAENGEIRIYDATTGKLAQMIHVKGRSAAREIQFFKDGNDYKIGWILSTEADKKGEKNEFGSALLKAK